MKKLLLLLSILYFSVANAQIKEVTLQASGLTCSMCSKAIYKALEKMGTAKQITSNIAQSSYTLTFDNNSKIDFDVIRKVVENAGFSIASMRAKAEFNEVKIYKDAHLSLNNLTLHFLDVNEQTLQGEYTFSVVDKKFVTDKVYKKYAATTKMECVKTGKMETCCAVNSTPGKRIYHVTM